MSSSTRCFTTVVVSIGVNPNFSRAFCIFCAHVPWKSFILIDCIVESVFLLASEKLTIGRDFPTSTERILFYFIAARRLISTIAMEA